MIFFSWLGLRQAAASDRLVEQLDAIQEAADQLTNVYESKLAALDELKKSLLHQAFTGALTAKFTDKQVAEVA